MSDIKAAKDTLQKNLEQKKKESVEEKKKLQDELDLQRKQHEEEVSALKSDVKKQQPATDVPTGEQQKKTADSKTNQQDDVTVWKQKYQKLHDQATVMKEHYEERMAELEGRINEERGKDTMVTEVKKIMNNVYKKLRGEFSSEKSYDGDHIHEVILNTVKMVTLQVVQHQEAASSDESVGNQPVEERITPEQISTSAACQRVKPQIQQVQTSIKPDIAKVTGDKGNPYYAAELKEHDIENIVAQVAKVTGDKGNVHYAKQLERCEKANAQQGKPSIAADLKKSSDDIGDIIVPTVASTSTRGAPVHSDIIPQVSHTSTKVAPVQSDIIPKVTNTSTRGAPVQSGITPKVASITGDKGNPHYLQELKEGNIEKIVATVSSVTGDKGNPHYSKELEVREQIIPEAASIPTEKFNQDHESSKDVITPQVMVGSAKSSPVQPAITAKIANVTGDKGNPEYARELNKQDQAASKGSNVQCNTAACKEGLIKPKQTYQTGGDAGNPHYAGELSSGNEVKTSSAKKAVLDPSKNLFDDDNMDDTLKFLSATMSAKKKSPAKVVETKPTAADSDDDLKRKPPPVPLFDDDDDDDLDWLK